MLCIFGDSHARRLSQYCHARYFSRGGCRLELPAKPKSSPSYAPIPDMAGGSSYSWGSTTSSQQTQHQKNGVESVQLGASHVEGGIPEHPYLPRRYMGEEEGFCCMGDDRETH